jgi:xylulokinase
MSLIGLDIGTTGCKATIFRADGSIVSQGRREYGIDTPHPGWAEQDAELVWRLTWQALAEACAAAKGDDPPVALAISCQGEAVIPVDGEGRGLRPAILGMDTRTTEQNRWLVETFSGEALFARTGMPVHTINTLPKLLWIQRHEAEIWRNAAQFLLYEDFFLRRLGGEAIISPCLASRTQMMDLMSGEWAEDILERCAIDPKRLAAVGKAGGVVGVLRPALARELGITGEVLLVSGGHDQACAALGSGVIAPGRAMVSTGTAEVVVVAMSTPVLAASLREGGISVYRHVAPGLYLAMTLNHSGGLLLRWFRDTCGRWEVAEAARTGQDAYDLLLADAPSGPTDLLLLPHFAGSGTPTLDTASKGAILGLTFASDRPTLAKAILEGLTFELCVNLGMLQQAGLAISELHAVGGGANSPLWLQLKADICQIPLRVPQVTEAASLGAALLAGVAAGVYPDFAAAVQATVRWRRQVEPQAAAVEAYRKRYALYREMYPLLQEFLHRL